MSEHRLTCGGCGHDDAVPDDPAQSVYTCSECKAVTTFGTTMPKIRVMPHDDRRFIRLIFNWGHGDQAGEAEFTLARQYGTLLAGELFSVCDAAKWAAICALAAKPDPQEVENTARALDMLGAAIDAAKAPT